MAYNAKGQKKYNSNSMQFNTIYRPGTDIKEGERLKAYLEQTNQTANSYIKKLIKRDLDHKGFMLDNLDGSVTTNIPGSHNDNNDNGIVADMDI